MGKKRKKGTGTIRLRKDGRWEGRMVVGYDDKGLPKTKNVFAKTKAECADKLKKLREEHSEIKTNKVQPDMPFGAWLDFWYLNYSKPRLRPTTQVCYENWIYNHAIPALGSNQLNKLTQSDLQQFFNGMKQGGRLNHIESRTPALSNRSVRGCWSICNKALEQAVKDKLIHSNPATGCKLPSPKSAEMQVLTTEEMQRFLIQAKAEGMYELFLLELTTGLRRGEILALQWEDLNWHTGELQISKQAYAVNGKLVVGEPKTKAGNRTIILPSPMLDVLQEYKQYVFSEWLFPSRIKPEQPVDPSYVRKRLQVILERSGCKKVRFHDLRHTFATMALEHGMDIKTLSTIIGHASGSTTLNIYAHITDEMRQKAAVCIDKGIVGAEIPETPEIPKETPKRTSFTPYKPPRRRPGTGCVSQINEHLWEGRYSPVWPDGKKHARNVYAKTLEECEEKLKVLIRDIKKEIAQEREKAV